MKLAAPLTTLAFVWATCGAGGAAHAQVVVYGTVDVAVGQLANQNPGPPTTAVTAIKGVFNGGVQTSHLGFRGSEDLGGGVLAKFALETFIRVDTGQPGRSDATPASTGDAFWSRNAYVGLSKAGLGEVRLGNNGNPLWITMLQTNAMGANSVFAPAFRQLYNGGTRGRSVIDTAMVNSVNLLTPVWAGFSANLAVQAGEGRGSRHNHAASATYRSGPLLVNVAVQSARHLAVPNIPTNARQDITLLGAAYDLKVLRVFGQFTTVDNISNKSRLPGFGVSVPLAGGSLQLATSEDRNKVVASGATSQRSTSSLGYLYPLSKRTEVYGFAMTEKFPVVGPAKNSGNSAVVGVRHTF